MITLTAVYAFAGLMFAGVALASLGDQCNPRRWTTALFWAGLALSFLAGDWLGDFGNGVLVLVLVGIAGSGGLSAGKPATSTPRQRQRRALSHGNALFLPALLIPAVALVGTLTLRDGSWVDPKQVTLIALAFGVLLALAVQTGIALVWAGEAHERFIRLEREVERHIGLNDRLVRVEEKLNALHESAVRIEGKLDRQTDAMGPRGERVK